MIKGLLLPFIPVSDVAGIVTSYFTLTEQIIHSVESGNIQISYWKYYYAITYPHFYANIGYNSDCAYCAIVEQIEDNDELILLLILMGVISSEIVEKLVKNTFRYGLLSDTMLWLFMRLEKRDLKSFYHNLRLF